MHIFRQPAVTLFLKSMYKRSTVAVMQQPASCLTQFLFSSKSKETFKDLENAFLCVCIFSVFFCSTIFFISKVESTLRYPPNLFTQQSSIPSTSFFKKREENSLFSAFFSSQGPIMHAEQRAEKYLTEEKLTEVYPEQTTIYLYY